MSKDKKETRTKLFTLGRYLDSKLFTLGRYMDSTPGVWWCRCCSSY